LQTAEKLKSLSKRVRAQTWFSHNTSYLYEAFEANKKLFRQGIKITKLKSFAEKREADNSKSFLAFYNSLDFTSKCVKCARRPTIACNLMKIEVTWKSLLERCTCLIYFNRSLIVHFAVDGNMICVDIQRLQKRS
jgi:hypothetical protein